MITPKTIKLNLFFLLFFSFLLKVYCQSGYISNDEGYEIISDSSGYYSKNNNFNIERLFPKNTWAGDRIWLNQSKFYDYQETQTDWKKNPGYKRQYKALFRKNFVLTKVPDQAFISITADIAFRLYINGTFIAQGPPDTGNDYFDGVPPRHWFFNTHTVQRYLIPGTNTIAVEVFSHSREISETSSGRGMLICDLDEGSNKNIVASDTSWKCNIDTSFAVNDGNYSCNSNYEITGWIDNSFDDSAWEYASVNKTPEKGYLVISKIPVPFRYPLEPKRLWLPNNETAITDYSREVFNRELNNAEFTLDYDRNITAYYGFEVIAHKNDTLKIYPYEKKYASQNRALIFVCKEGINVFKAPFLSVFRYLKVEVKSEKGLTIKGVHTDFSSYPVDHAGNFSCSDQSLTKLWDITRWTTQLCMNDMFYDSPKHQEPIACTGDYFIQSLINYYAFGDPWLTRQTLVKTALLLEKNNYDMFHTSYSLLWVQMLYQYYQYAGDIQLVKELLPHVNKLNQLFETYLDNDYLVSNAPDYMFMDWIKIDKFNAHHPPAVIGMGYMTAFYYKSLMDAADLNSLINNNSIRDKNLELANNIKMGMNEILWDSEKNLYKDGIPFRSKKENHYFFPMDTTITTYSPHVNALAVLYDIAPANQQSAILNFIVNQKTTDLQPYFMFYVLSAADHTGQFNTTGSELLKKWENGINPETYTLKENWQDQTETGYGGDYSHAWGGSPLYFMSRNILGVKPGVPGYREIEIIPFINDDIKWARGRVPLMQGNSLGISWERENRLKYIYTLEIPDNYKVFMVIPKNMVKRSFQINNKKYLKETNRVQLHSGIYTIEFQDD
ncbi:MAG: alpha-L-rhamnosidase C-terminal domain-containing protein [Lentimicrobium sp.]